MGGQTKETYLKLAQLDGASVRIRFNCLPFWLAFLRFIPAYGGIVEIADPMRVAQVIDELSVSGMVGLYVFDAQRDQEFIQLIGQKPHPKLVDDWQTTVHEGLFYEFDSGNPSSRTDMYDWLKFGEALPFSVRSDLESLWRGRS
jgi:hypothetical protein